MFTLTNKGELLDEMIIEDEFDNEHESTLDFNSLFSSDLASFADIKKPSNTTRNTKRINRRTLAKLLKLRLEQNSDNTLPLESYKTILSELFHVMGEAILHGNDICIYPIGVISTSSRFGELYNDDESIDDWFFVNSRISLTSSFKQKLKLYMLSRQSREDIEKFKEALRIAQVTEFKIAQYRRN